MKTVTRHASLAFMVAFALVIAGAPVLQGQDANPASSVVPPVIKFSGVMAAPAAQNPTSGTAVAGLVTTTFSLYEFQEGGAPLWSETQKVQLDEQGHYLVLLGATSATGLPLDLFASGKALWLGVQPQWPGTGEMPRVLLAPVPYALKASDADTLGGKPASAYALAGAPAVVALGIGAALPSASRNPISRGSHEDAALVSPAGAQPLTACSAITSDGTAAANEIAKFTAACNLEKSLLRDTGTAVAVGGMATPGALFDVQFGSTATSGTVLGQRVLTTLTPTAASSAIINGLFSNTLTASGNAQNFTGKLAGMNSEMDHYGTGTVTGGYGLNALVFNRAAGTVNNAYGIYTSLSNVSTGKISTGYGMYINSPANTGGGTFTSYTGLYIGSPGTISGAYGLYSAGGKNYFSGDVGIGTSTPGANLEVNGTTKFDGLATFAAGQTFPGVPALTASSNTFTGSITASSFTGSGLHLTNVNAAELGGVTAGSFAVTTGYNGFEDYQVIDSANSYSLFVNNESTTANSQGIYSSMNGTGGTIGSGTAAIYALNKDTSDSGMGLYAKQDGNGYGVFGEANGASGDGVYGTSTLGFAVYGQSTGGDGVVGYTGIAGGNWAFYGFGNIGATGTKSSVVPVDNSSRQVALYAVEAPEVWFEDYGSGHLDSGAAAIAFEPVFAQTVNTSVEYHVFLTPEGECDGLYVANKTAKGFEVHELHHGSSSVAFDYRIIARRKGYEATRLADVTRESPKLKPASMPEGRSTAGLPRASRP